jgi:hypothetical protein
MCAKRQILHVLPPMSLCSALLVEEPADANKTIYRDQVTNYTTSRYISY